MSRLTSQLVIVLVAALIAGCSSSTSQPSAQRTAPELMTQYGCPTCHVIPGVPGAAGKVGPALDDINDSSYLAGSLPNTPRNLQLWIMHPQQYRPGVAMPEMGVTQHDAALITDHLREEH